MDAAHLQSREEERGEEGEEEEEAWERTAAVQEVVEDGEREALRRRTFLNAAIM